MTSGAATLPDTMRLSDFIGFPFLEAQWALFQTGSSARAKIACAKVKICHADILFRLGQNLFAKQKDPPT
jgi:hypothetical protein